MGAGLDKRLGPDQGQEDVRGDGQKVGQVEEDEDGLMFVFWGGLLFVDLWGLWRGKWCVSNIVDYTKTQPTPTTPHLLIKLRVGILWARIHARLACRAGAVAVMQGDGLHVQRADGDEGEAAQRAREEDGEHKQLCVMGVRGGWLRVGWLIDGSIHIYNHTRPSTQPPSEHTHTCRTNINNLLYTLVVSISLERRCKYRNLRAMNPTAAR